jgi:hypothetical protein
MLNGPNLRAHKMCAPNIDYNTTPLCSNDKFCLALWFYYAAIHSNVAIERSIVVKIDGVISQDVFMLSSYGMSSMMVCWGPSRHRTGHLQWNEMASNLTLDLPEIHAR